MRAGEARMGQGGMGRGGVGPEELHERGRRGDSDGGRRACAFIGRRRPHLSASFFGGGGEGNVVVADP
jgi:hypothetical protein